MMKPTHAALLAFFSALPCAAMAADSPLPAGKHDKHAPIEVTSDTLEVYQKENHAIFTGHVIAIQQEMRLEADEMIVYYSPKSDDKTAVPKAAKAPAGSPQESAIKRIDANGHVFLSTPEETASGVKGIYDVESHNIRLNDNVVLTKGANVLKGDAMVYDFETGKSVMTSESAPDEKTADGKPHPRVRALFVPANKPDKKEGAK